MNSHGLLFRLGGVDEGLAVEDAARPGAVGVYVLGLAAGDSEVGEREAVKPAPRRLDVGNRVAAPAAGVLHGSTYCSETTAPGSPRGAAVFEM